MTNTICGIGEFSYRRRSYAKTFAVDAFEGRLLWSDQFGKPFQRIDLGKPFQRIDPGKPLDGLRYFLVLRLKKMFELMVMPGHECLGSNDPGIRKIPGALTQPAGLGDFEALSFLLFQEARINHLDLAFIRPVYGTRMVHVFTVPAYALLFTLHVEFFFKRNRDRFFMLYDQSYNHLPWRIRSVVLGSFHIAD